MLMNPEVVGNQLENFSFGYEPRYDEEGERLFGSISECEAMRKLDEACRAEHGDDTCPVIINISSDATHVNRNQQLRNRSKEEQVMFLG